MTTELSRERKEINKGKHTYIADITGGEPQENVPSKGTMKRKIAEMLAIYHKEGNTSTKIIDRLMGFKDSKNAGGIPKEKFPIVIISTRMLRK